MFFQWHPFSTRWHPLWWCRGSEPLLHVHQLLAVELAAASYSRLLAGPRHAQRGRLRAFLRTLAHCAHSADVNLAPRAYRAGWTQELQRHLLHDAPFALAAHGSHEEDTSELYGAVVLEAAFCGRTAATNDAVANWADELVDAWAHLGNCLLQWYSETRSDQSAVLRAMESFDLTWAAFEDVYARELAESWACACKPLADAIASERRLQVAGATCHDVWHHFDCACREAVRDLVEKLARLSVVAHCACQGREDWGDDVFVAASAALRYCELLERARCVVSYVASSVVESFAAVRHQLKCLPPNGTISRAALCSDESLVHALSFWAESWEVGCEYLLHHDKLHALCAFVSQLSELQDISPIFSDMVESRSPELFLVLPRLLWCCFLLDELSSYKPLVSSFLFHSFNDSPSMRESLDQFIHRFSAVLQRSCKHRGASALLDQLVREVTSNSFCQSDATGQAADEQFMGHTGRMTSELERWSFELQRTCPGQWNRFCFVVIQGLASRHT